MSGGSVYRRGDGRWCGEVRISGRRVYVYGRSKREARDKLTAVVAAGKAGERRRGTVGGLLDRHLADLSHTHAPRTWERYEGLVRLYLAPALGSIPVATLTVEHVAGLQSALLAHGLAPRSVKLAMGLLRSVLGAGSVAHGVRPPRLPPPRNRALSLDEAKRLIAACRDDRERLLLLLTLGLGLRLGEACAVHSRDVADGRLAVRFQLQRVPHPGGANPYQLKRPKDSSGRVIPLVAQLQEIVERRLCELESGGFLLGDAAPLSPRSAQFIAQRLAERAGVPALRFHDLRHSSNTFLAAAGVDAKTRMLLLGHRSVRVHAEYTHPDEAMLREAVTRLGAALS